jgi:hypothetical protein
MVRTPRTQTRRHAFATSRSHQASEIAYNFSRYTGQACLLINGGAATAVIAFLTKDKVDPTLYTIIPWCLALYAAGVFAGAAMLFCEMMNADYWNYHWYYIAYEQDTEEADSCEKIADRWHRGYYFSFIAAVCLFIAASVLMAYALRHVQPPTVIYLLAPG